MPAYVPARMRGEPQVLPALGVALVAAALYVATLAPGLMWGDDAELQRLATVGNTRVDAHGHPMWFWIAMLVARLPFGSIAWRVNLSSAICGAFAVGLVFLVASRLTHRRGASALAALAFAVSHTQWMHAVRAEVYALFMAMLAFTLLAFAEWRETRRPGLLFLMGLLAGATLLSHMLIVTALPGLVVGVWASAAPGRRLHALALFLGGWLAGLGLFLGRAGIEPVLHPMYGHGGPFSILSPPAGRDVVRWAAFTLYQFPLAAPLVAWGVRRTLRQDAALAWALLLVALGDVGFGLCFHVPDQYVFYMPAYLIAAIFLAFGVRSLREAWQRPGLRSAALVGALVLAPPLVYRIAPVIAERAHFSLVSPRTLPGRDNDTYFMYPSKRGERSADRFAREAFSVLPESALVVADWAPLEPLRYLQEVEHERPDLSLEESRPAYPPQVDSLLELSHHRAVFIADDEPPPYYDIAAIRRRFVIRPTGPLFMLVPRHGPLPRVTPPPPQKTVARSPKPGPMRRG